MCVMRHHQGGAEKPCSSRHLGTLQPPANAAPVLDGSAAR
jgi:hypothetical protein